MGLSFLKRSKKEKESSSIIIYPPEDHENGQGMNRGSLIPVAGTKSASIAEHSKSVGSTSVDNKSTPTNNNKKKNKQGSKPTTTTTTTATTTSSPGGNYTDDGTPDTAGLTPPALISPLIRDCPNTQEVTPVRSNVNDNHNIRGGDKKDDGFEMVLSSINNDGSSANTAGNNRKYSAKYHPGAPTLAKTSLSSAAFTEPLDNDYLTGKNLTNLFNCASGDDCDDEDDNDEKDDWDFQLESRNKGSDGEHISWDDRFDGQNNSAVSSGLGGGGDRHRTLNRKTTNETKFLRRLKRRNISKKSKSKEQQQQQQGEESNSSAVVAAVASPLETKTTKTPSSSYTDKKYPVVPQFINQYDDDGSMPSNLTEPEITHRKTPSPRMVTPPSALLGPSARDTNTSNSTMIMRRNRSLRSSSRYRSGGLPPPLVETFSGAEESTRGGAESVTILTSLVSKAEEADTNTIDELLSLFRCNEDSTSSNITNSLCGAIPCDQSVACGPLFAIGGGVGASCLPSVMRKDLVETEKEKEEKFALDFQRVCCTMQINNCVFENHS